MEIVTIAVIVAGCRSTAMTGMNYVPDEPNTKTSSPSLSASIVVSSYLLIPDFLTTLDP